MAHFYTLWTLDKYGNTSLLEREDTFLKRRDAFERAETLIKYRLYGVDTTILVRKLSTRSRRCVQWEFAAKRKE